MQAKAHARVEAVVRGEPLCEREREAMALLSDYVRTVPAVRTAPARR